MTGWNWKSDIREGALAPAGIMHSAAGGGASAGTGKPADLMEKFQDRRRGQRKEEPAGADRGRKSPPEKTEEGRTRRRMQGREVRGKNRKRREPEETEGAEEDRGRQSLQSIVR